MNHQPTTTVNRRTIRAAIELASRAPSIHNSQPWRWLLGPRSVHLYTDPSRRLPVTDADGRDLLLSCGAALHHLRAALAATGHATGIHRLPNPDEPDHLAAVTVWPATATKTDLNLAKAIQARRTDRRGFSTWEVPQAFVQELVAHATDQGSLLRPVTSPRLRDTLFTAIREAGHVQEATPGYPTETALWSSGATDGTGIPATNLLRDPTADPTGTARRFSPGTLEQATIDDDGGADDGTDDGDGALLLVLGTASDDTLSRLRAGEAASAVLLHATALGLASCPLSQPLEIGHTRTIVREQVLGGTLSPQLVLRIGWAATDQPLPATPRRPVDDTIERMPQ